MVSSKFFVVLSGSAIVAGLAGPAQAVAPRSGEHGTLEPSMIQSDAAGTQPFVGPCQVVDQTDMSPNYLILDNFPNPTACRYRCQSETKCKSYTFNWDSKKCYLKDQQRGLSRSQVKGDVSGPKECKVCESEGKTSKARDYRKVKSEDSNACKKACNDEPMCAWWSYNKNSKICRFKPRLEEVVNASDAGEVTGPPICELGELWAQTSTGESFRRFDDVDSIYTCRSICRSDPECFYYTYNVPERKCYLKWQLARIGTGAGSDLSAPANPKTCELKYGEVDAPDIEVTEGIVPDTTSCRARCKSNTACTWWTYNTEKRKCHLKSKGGIKDANWAHISGPKECEKCAIPNRTGDGHNTLVYENVISADSCQSRCRMTDQCNWYTYNTWTRNCYLKPNEGKVVPSQVKHDITGPKIC